MLNRSNLFSAYNSARRMVRTGQLDGKRLNRALGIAQSGPVTDNHIVRYGSTSKGCSCPDRRFRGATCKGMIAVALKEVSE